MNLSSLFTNEAILAAIIGALVGSGVSYILVTISDRRKQRREVRHSIVAELTTIGHNYLATLQELQAAKEAAETGAARSSRAQLVRLDGNLSAIQTRLWYFFSERKVRAALSRFRSRCVTVTEYLSAETRSPTDADIAINWLAAGMEELFLQTAKVARLPVRDPARVVWVGFRKVTPQDKRLLSFEDEPPPWVFSVTFDFTRKVEESILEKVRSKLEKQAGHLKCKEHHRAAHLVFYGADTKHFDIQMEVCCQEFGAVVSKAINLDIGKASLLSDL